MWLGWFGPAIFVGMFIAACAWMAYGDEDPRWIRGTIRNIAYVVGCFGGLFVAVWALEGWGFI